MQNQIDSSEQVKSHFYTAGDGCYVRLSPTAWKILSGRESGRSFEELAQQISNESRQEVSPENVEQAWQYLNSKVEDIRKKSSPLRAGFWLKLPLLSRSLVTKLAGLLWPAFHPVVAAVLLSFIVIGGMRFWAPLNKEVAPLQTEDIVIGYLLYLFSILIHELGHSSACLRYGAQPSAIGFTLYLVYPAFYSDVSDAWRLRRWQRVIVDLSGMYFQLVIGAAFAIAWHYTAWRSFRMATYAVIASGLVNLNPILRFDGYWLLCDLLGVTNLGRQPINQAKNFIMRLRGRKPDESRWPYKISLILSIYSVAWFAFFSWFLWHIGPFIFASLGNYPQLLRDNLNALRGNSNGFSPRSLLSLLLSTAIMIAVLRLLWIAGLRSLFRRVASGLNAQMGRR